MSAARYRIRGTVSDAATPDAGAGVAVLHGRRLIPGRARDGVTGELEVAADEVVRIELAGRQRPAPAAIVFGVDQIQADVE